MPYQLFKSPRGLIELLRLKTNGRNPDEFASTVSPTLDVTDFYGADVLFTAETVGAAAAMPLNITTDVTTTRRFWGLSFQVTLGAAAGTRLNLRLALRGPGAANPVFILASSVITAGLVAGQNYNVGVLFPRPIVLTSSWQINAVALSDAAGADHVPTLQSISELLSPA